MDLSRLSTSTYPLISRPLPEALGVIAAAGFGQADLLGRMPHFSLKADEWDPAAAIATARSAGVGIANLASYVGNGFASEDEAEQQREWQDVTRAMEIAGQVGARTARLLRFNSPADNPAFIDRLAPWFRKTAQLAARHGVKVGIENHRGPLIGNPDRCLELCQKVGHPAFGIIYDPANLHMLGVDYKSAFRQLRDHIIHVHLKDCTREVNSQKSTMLGQGDIDLPWILSELRQAGYGDGIMLEYEVETVPVETGLKQWRETFERLAGE